GVAAGRREDARAVEPGDLDRGARDAASRGLHEHRLAGPDARLVDDHLPRGQKDERHRRDLREGEIARIREEVGVRHVEVARVASVRVLADDGVALAQVVLSGEAPLAYAARDAGADDDPGADVHPASARSERLDLADDVRSEAVRILELEVRHPAPHPEVEVVGGHRANPDARLPRPRLGEVDGLAHEHLGPAVRAEDDGFGLHRRGASRPTYTRSGT